MRTVLFYAWPQYDEAELEFWRDLKAALASFGLELLLVSTNPPPADLEVAHITFVPTLDSLWQGHGASAVSITDLGLDPGALLAREDLWYGPRAVPALRDLRRQALDAVATHAINVLAAHRPAVAAIWNGAHVPEMILDAALRQGGTPVVYVERAPIPRALFADDRGLSAASAIAAERVWPRPDDRWARRAQAIAGRIARGNITWWDQPGAIGQARLRRELQVPDGHRVVLFAGQVDEDTQRFQFSPLFPDNLSAWRWLLSQLAGRRDIFVLGKQHPKASVPPEAYARVLAESGVPGVWRSDIAIDDALAVAERVAAVNSTVLYEALARDVPALAMGEWLLGGRGAAYEITDLAAGGEPIDAWLDAADAAERRANWRAALGHLVSRSVYAYERGEVVAGSLGARDLAARLAGQCHGAVWQPPAHVPPALLHGLAPASWVNPGDQQVPANWTAADRAHLSRWREAQTLHYFACRATDSARRGRRVLIWGTGESALLFRSLLGASGVTPAAYVSARPESRSIEGVPVIGPDGLSPEGPRDFVVLADATWNIPPELTAHRFVEHDDYVQVDCRALRRLVPSSLPIAC